MRDQLIVAPEPADLVGLEALWSGELSNVYEAYLELGEPRVALAAAMVDTAARLQKLGGPAPGAADLLMGDLCLARASRLLADVGDMRLQVAFARAIEQASAAAAAEEPGVPVRDLLSVAIRGRV
jgi:hypothetical protein